MFLAELMGVRVTPSRETDVRTLTRITLDVQDLQQIDWLVGQIGRSVQVSIDPQTPSSLPLETAIEAANGQARMKV
jgi:hypothetical protein